MVHVLDGSPTRLTTREIAAAVRAQRPDWALWMSAYDNVYNTLVRLERNGTVDREDVQQPGTHGAPMAHWGLR